ncbi:MAG: NBR1-Ig-like domain-containing protein [Gammaproteobacteria bacterium]|nr:NBR1-Ig-like domain-containing protein [Gammaproteobacteria bacterium]
MRYLLAILLLSNPFIALSYADENFAATILRAEIPKILNTGQGIVADLRIRNDGTETLSSQNGVEMLFNTNQRAWPDQAISLGNFKIKPGQTENIKLRVNGPSRSGIYLIDWRLKQEQKEISPATASEQIVVESASNQVRFISQVVPENMNAGEKYMIIVQFRNDGKYVWNNDDGYRLGITGSDEKAWGNKLVSMRDNEVVPPGEIASFRFEIAAPTDPGNYALQWRLKKNRKDWIGEPTPVSVVTVTQGTRELDAEFMHQVLPNLQHSTAPFTIFNSGEIYPITITFKNTGSQPWLPDIYHLEALDTKADIVWSVSRVELHDNEVVHSGQLKSFTFKVIAPLDPGIYNFQWRLKKGNETWVGQATENVVVTVQR